MEFSNNPIEFNKMVVESLLGDGSDPDATYTLEHHFASQDFDKLEKAAVSAYKLGYEASDAEEFETDDGLIILSFDVFTDVALDVEKINEITKQMSDLAKKHGVDYDGWGTEYIDPDGEDYDEDDDNEDDSEDDNEDD